MRAINSKQNRLYSNGFIEKNKAQYVRKNKAILSLCSSNDSLKMFKAKI